MSERCICTTLRQAAAFGTAYYDAALAPSGVKVTMFRLLRWLDRTGAVSISELADIVGLDRSTLGRNLRVLEKQALIRMRKGQDGRARQIELSDKGRDTLHAAEPLWESAQSEFKHMIGPDVAAVLDQLASLGHQDQNYSDLQI